MILSQLSITVQVPSNVESYETFEYEDRTFSFRRLPWDWPEIDRILTEAETAGGVFPALVAQANLLRLLVAEVDYETPGKVVPVDNTRFDSRFVSALVTHVMQTSTALVVSE